MAGAFDNAGFYNVAFFTGIGHPAFDGTAFDNVGFYTSATTSALVSVEPRPTYGGGAFIAPFIKWGRKRKKKEQAVEEVADAIAQAVAASPDLPPLDKAEQTDLALTFLRESPLIDLRRMQSIAEMADKIARQIAEDEEDDEILLLN